MTLLAEVLVLQRALRWDLDVHALSQNAFIRLSLGRAALNSSARCIALMALSNLARWHLSKCQHDSHVKAGSIVPPLLVDQMQRKAGFWGGLEAVFSED